ncbi:ABC transporter permease [Chryseolinea sp. H1M3-3]|uniref:ABC transporter permease n=1 Tax=Chryseolinea sp. H1M3-3 TaxID=3034144 RepID=UPI0023EAB1B8|nr:ABC transporter permease [Chryseolinea sp. H1M3-3]
MNLSYFISKRISREQKQGFASSIHTIAIIIVGVGLAAVIVSFLIMRGFQETVKNKIYSFNGHLTVTKYTMNYSREEQPMNYYVDLYKNPQQYPFIKHAQEYAHKPGLVKTGDDEVLGIIVKGVGRSYDVNAFQENMVEGKFVDFPDSSYSNQVVISRIISNKLQAKVGDEITVHFFQNPPRVRKLAISGIYETNLAEYFDSNVILGDLRMIQRLNDWSDSLAGGLEIFLKNPSDIEEAGYAIGETMDFDLNIESVNDKYIQVFEWLNLLSRQVNILLGIILVVVSVNIVSIVLILVMERTQMIGLLKALGGGNKFIRSIFIYNGINLITKGLLLGNIVGLGLCYLQYRFRLVKLNPHDYYMSFVPISWEWQIVGVLNIFTFLIVSFVLLLPTMVIARINPIKAIRFD